jgi:hypothetical protein
LSSFLALLKKKYFCKIIAHDTTENRSKSNKTLFAMTLEFSIRFTTLKEFSDKGSCTASFCWGHLEVGATMTL